VIANTRAACEVALRRAAALPGRSANQYSLAPVRAYDVRGAVRRDRRTEEGQRKRVAEDDDVDIPLADQRPHRRRDASVRPQRLGPVADDIEALCPVERAPTRGRRSQHRDAIGREVLHEVVDVLLDAAEARREVVRHDEGPGTRRRRTAGEEVLGPNVHPTTLPSRNGRVRWRG
jgi:hypothetical protein